MDLMHQFEFFNILPVYKQNAEIMYNWCIDMFGEYGLRWKFATILSTSRDVWTFYEDADAALFKLTWM
jgi:hypothetical protein